MSYCQFWSIKVIISKKKKKKLSDPKLSNGSVSISLEELICYVI